MIDKIFSIIKLPMYIIFILFIILGLLLFSPSCFLDILQLNEFIEQYRIYFGITFLFLGSFIIVFFYVYKFLFPTVSDKNKYLEIL